MIKYIYAPIAQLDRVSPSDGEGWEFKSLWVRHRKNNGFIKPFFICSSDFILKKCLKHNNNTEIILSQCLFDCSSIQPIVFQYGVTVKDNYLFLQSRCFLYLHCIAFFSNVIEYRFESFKKVNNSWIPLFKNIIYSKTILLIYIQIYDKIYSAICRSINNIIEF